MIKKSVNIENIRKNIKKLKSIAQTKFCAVVKAGAYGHGIELCKDIADLVDYFAVANKSEALSLKNMNLQNDILVLGKVANEDYHDLINNEIKLTVDDIDDLYHIECIATSLNKIAYVHLKINTGMNRLGIKTKSDFLQAYDLIKQCKFVKLDGIYTHFATADSNIAKLKKQNAKFKYIINHIPQNERENLTIHASNSSAFLLSKEYAYDMVRVGIAMYGYDQTNTLKLEPALKIQSKIVKIIKVHKGESVGYDASFVAPNDMTLAVVSMGYADGFSRAYEKGYVLIKGKEAKIVGHICMDMFMCDITHILTPTTNQNIKNNEKQCEENKVFNIFKSNSDKSFANFDIENKLKNQTPHIKTEIFGSIFTNLDTEQQSETTYFKNDTIYKLLHNEDKGKEQDLNIFDIMPVQDFLNKILSTLNKALEDFEEEPQKISEQTLLGEYATILGKDGDEEITAQDLAKLSNTIEYEVLTNFNLCRE